MADKVKLPITTKMKAKWIRALRSGRYKRGKGKLGNEKMGYCCLGVLAKCTRIELSDHSLNVYSGFLKEGDLGAPIRIPHDVQSRLATMNDKETYDTEKEITVPKYSFAEIATWVKKHVKAVRS